MAEQLYLAVELRCDLNDQKIDVPGCCNKNTLLEMDDNEAEQYLRKSVVRTEYEKGLTIISKMGIIGIKKGYD